MISLKTSVRIERPIEEAFAYVSDPLRFPAWNSAVRSVRQTSSSTYEMERDLPTGRACNELEIVVLDPPAEFAIRTTSGPTPFVYRYRLSEDGAGTLLAFDAEIQLPRIAGPAIRRGIEANLATLVRELHG
jgi:carbon monoxide dehydrogenase subunit G